MATVKRQWRRHTHNGNNSDDLLIDFEFQFDGKGELVTWGLMARLEQTLGGSPYRAREVDPQDPIGFDTYLAPMFILRGHFELIRTSTRLYVDAKDITFGFELQLFNSFEGVALELSNCGPSDSTGPIEPSESDARVPDIAHLSSTGTPEVGITPATQNDDAELFPYVYMRRWPEPNPEQIAERFIPYPHRLDSAPSWAFVRQLFSIRHSNLPNAREQSINLAVEYINGRTGDDVPFIRDQARLPASLADYLTALGLLQSASNPTTVLDQALTLLGTTITALSDYLAERQMALVQVWQSNFALIIVLDDDASLRDTLARILRMNHLLAWVADHPDTAPSADVYRRLLEAVVELPEALFPLPSAGGAPTSLPEAKISQIAPYAIGELQMTRHRRVGYAADELAALECLQPGEHRETVRRRRNSEFSSSSTIRLDDEVDTSRHKSLDTSLKSQTQSTLADTTYATHYNDFSASYGAPATANVNGGWTVEAKPTGAPANADTTRFAQEILSKAAQRVSHRVVEARGRTYLSEDEESTTSVVDNSQSLTPRCAAYYWLDELFEAYVVNYGDRLILELLVEDPAAVLLREDDDPNWPGPLPIPAPAALGLETFEDITAGNFPRIVTAYPTVRLELPPTGTRTVSTVLRSGQAATLELPEGTVAEVARVCAVSMEAGTQVQVLVGQTSFSFTVDSPVVEEQPLNKEQGTVQVAAELIPPVSSFPPDPDDSAVTVAVDTVPSRDALNTWKLKTFQAIQDAYSASLNKENSISADPCNRTWPQRRRQAQQLERGALMRAGMRLLFERTARLFGEDLPSKNPRSRFFSARPRYLQFFETSFEWKEMSYAVLGRSRSPSPTISSLVRDTTDPGFLAFLEAEYARILLPISLAHAPAVLFFLSSGMLWDGPASLVPSFACDVALRNDLAGLVDKPGRTEQVGAAWTIRVPTSFKILKDLPFRSDAMAVDGIDNP